MSRIDQRYLCTSITGYFRFPAPGSRLCSLLTAHCLLLPQIIDFPCEVS